MDDDVKFHQTWHLLQLPSFYQQFLFIFYSVYKNKPRGVTVRDLIRFIKRNYYLDGDLCPQLITVLKQAMDQGVIEERGDKFHLVGPIASVQNSAPNSPERRSELKSVYGIFNFNSTQRKARSGSIVSASDNKEPQRKSSRTSEGVPKKESFTTDVTKKKCGSQEKCPSVGLALQEHTITNALKTKLNNSDNNSVTPASRFVPNITVLSKIRQYFETTVCKCNSKASSKTNKSLMSKPSSATKSSLNTMKTSTRNSKHSKNSKDVSLKSRHDISTDEYFSSHSKSDKLGNCRSKSPKLENSSQGMSLQATRSKTPTQCTLVPDKKPSDARTSESKYSDANNQSVLSFMPIISTFQHYMGCNHCDNDIPSESSKHSAGVFPSTRTLRPKTVASRKTFSRSGLSPQKQPHNNTKLRKRLAVRFRTMGRDQCNGQFCSLRRKSRHCKPCKVRISHPSTANSSRPMTRNTYTATRTSMRTRSSTRGCPSAFSSKGRSLGKSSFSLRSTKATRKKNKKRQSTASSFKTSPYKRRKIHSRNSSLGDSYWGDFCCV